jgi:hypothetical protein
MAAWVSVHRVLRLANPLQSWPWDAVPTGTQCSCLADGQLVRTAQPVAAAWSGGWVGIEPGSQHEAISHLGRIRYLMERGWDDAIEIDVGIPVMQYHGPKWKVLDGNHRLAAAALRGDEHILVTVAGQLDHAAELLGVSEEALLEEV